MARRATNAAVGVEQKGSTNQRRVTNAGVEVEQKGSTNPRRVTNAGVEVEQKLAINWRRVTNLAIVVEYRDGIQPSGIASAEAFGTPTISTAGPPIEPTGIPSAEAFGTPTVTTSTPPTPRATGYVLCAGETIQTIVGFPQVVILIAAAARMGPFDPIARTIAGIKEQIMGTHIQSLGLSLHCYSPTIVPYTSYNPKGSYLGRLDQKIASWSHTVNITKGFAAASMSLVVSREEVEDWLENGLGRHIELKNETGTIIWEGFVNRVEAGMGPLTFGVGPLTDIGNIVNVIYTPVDYTIDPPVRGATTSTLAVTNDRSIARYGVFSQTLSVGECTEEEAERYRDTWLAKNAWPKPTKDVNIGSTNAATLQIELAGYADFFNLYDYGNDSIAITTISAKIAAVLAAETNHLLSTDYTRITENLFAVPESEPSDKQRMAWDVLKTLVALGDANDNRYAFGVYENRRVRYFPIPTTITYKARLDDPGQNVLTQDMSAVVRPWNVQPGYWIQYTDLMVGRKWASDPTTDPRNILIEEVVYSTPWSLQLRNGDAGTLPQIIAKMGFNG